MVAFALPTSRSTRPTRQSASLSEVIAMVLILGSAAATWGVIMAVAPLLQIRRMLARGSSADVSLGYFAVLLPGFVLWICYGGIRRDWALVIPNSVALAVGLLTAVIAVALRSPGKGRTVTVASGRYPSEMSDEDCGPLL